MFLPSDDFITAATNNYRDPRSRVEITWFDSITQGDLVVTTNDQNRGAIMPQVTDGVETTTHKWAYLSTGRANEFILDGTYRVSPSDLISGQVGWYSQSYCNASGFFTVNPRIDLSYNEASVNGSKIIIQFDTQYNQYAVDFQIFIYRNALPVKIITVSGNTQTRLEYDLVGNELNQTDLISFVISKWSEPFDIVKVVEFGIQTKVVYYDDEVYSVNVTENMEVDSGTIPIGNMAANQAEITIVNKDNRFDYGNVNSAFHNLLKKDRKIRVWFGFVLPAGSTDISSGDYIVETINGEKIGFTPFGTFWSDDWVTDKRTLNCSTSARDLMEKLRTTEFTKSGVYSNITLYDLADLVLTQANVDILENFQYNINIGLKNITVPIAFFDKQSYFKTIKQIVSVAQTTAFTDRKGVLQVGSYVK